MIEIADWYSIASVALGSLHTITNMMACRILPAEDLSVTEDNQIV